MALPTGPEPPAADAVPDGGRTAGDSPAEAMLRLQSQRLQVLNRIARAIASDLELDRIVQTVTDGAREATGARWCAFFYNAVGPEGESYVDYILSGAAYADFDGFAMPRKTAVFQPTFDGTGIVRSDDIRIDPRYGRNPPHHGMPKGHLPVVSYLAAPVLARTGEVHGGLFLGHDQPGMFSAESEELVVGIAAHAAIAIDNARLLRAARSEARRSREAEAAAARLAAIVASSDDAIVGKNLDGIIQSWNKGAERLFGYSEAEAIGRSILMLIPEEHQHEEPLIIARICKGERVDHFETIRRRKDGSPVDISLTISPIRDLDGRIVGASKIARDITERRRSQERQSLLLREMSHRVKNLFTLATSIVALSARFADTPQALAGAIRDRLMALARAHDLTLPDLQAGATGPQQRTTLLALLGTILEPYHDPTRAHVLLEGSDVPIGGGALTGIALLLHELATNAAKYGALSVPTGQLDVRVEQDGPWMRLLWRESGGPPPGSGEVRGFGSLLEQSIVKGQLAGTIERDWRPEGVVIRLSLPLERLTG